MKITDKYAPNLIISIILVFSLIGFTVTAILNFYVTNEKAYISNSDDNNIPAIVTEEIEKYFDNSTNYSKIPADVYMSAISEDDVKQVIDGKIINLFSHYKKNGGADTEDQEYKHSDFDYSKLEESIKGYFDKFANENNIKKDDEYTAQMEHTIQAAKDEMENYADVYMLSLIDNTGILKRAFSYYNDLAPAMYVCGGLALLCMLLLIAISLTRTSLASYWMAVSFICASVIMLVPTLMIKLSKFEEKLIVRNNSIYTAVTNFISKVVNGMIILETAVIVLGVLLLILYFTKKKKALKKKLREKKYLEDLKREAAMEEPAK